jgi:hypothetical protein
MTSYAGTQQVTASDENRRNNLILCCKNNIKEFFQNLLLYNHKLSSLLVRKLKFGGFASVLTPFQLNCLSQLYLVLDFVPVCFPIAFHSC